ncbi:MAG: hypothetical protein PHG54_05355 [Smithellaceae bacterium]|nr:hypothetical protein [Syntrophaceae bacterium]MDD4240838.1 hypothetical protein [Smithellaceae bacterium]NLX51702.1 methionine synthase [Deltaproteobacteria bacterium]
MQTAVTFLDKITIAPPTPKIYARLGFRKKSTAISAARREETDRHIGEAAALIHLSGSYRPFSILQNDGRIVALAGGVSFSSEKLAAFLGRSRTALFLGATAGSAVMDAIREKTAMGDMTRAVVYDATASEMADAALDWIMAYVNRQLLRESRRLLPRRFSAGYADFALENQKILHEQLQMERLGVSLTPRFLLAPEKSVTAIGAIP